MLIIIDSIFTTSILILIGYLYLAISSKRWNHVIGNILSVNIRKYSHPPKRIGAPMFEIKCAPSINYEYVVNGKRYLGKRIRFSAINRWYDNENAMYDDLGFADGDSVDVHYFKHIPSISVIKPNDSELPIYIMLILFNIAGIFAVTYFYCNAL